MLKKIGLSLGLVVLASHDLLDATDMQIKTNLGNIDIELYDGHYCPLPTLKTMLK